MRRTASSLLLAALTCALIPGCSAAPAPGDTGAGRTATLDVFVAASLAGPLGAIAEDFQAGHQGVTVRVSPGGSSDLVAQALAGAPADVLITADERTMTRLTDADDTPATGRPVPVATNTPALVVPARNPAGIITLDDAATARLVVCAPQVPCGDAALRLAAAAGVTLHPVSEEASVTDVLAKVTSGEADAGIVYATDARPGETAGTLDTIDVPETAQIRNRAYVVALDGPEADLARTFVEALAAEPAQAVLREAGFGTP